MSSFANQSNKLVYLQFKTTKNNNYDYKKSGANEHLAKITRCQAADWKGC
jgi:hypothetical protein